MAEQSPRTFWVIDGYGFETDVVQAQGLYSGRGWWYFPELGSTVNERETFSTEEIALRVASRRLRLDAARLQEQAEYLGQRLKQLGRQRLGKWNWVGKIVSRSSRS